VVDLRDIATAVPARVTADARFVLHVNGHEVARGPARSAPERIAFETLDLAPWLIPGRNVLAAEVRFYAEPMPWWRPARPAGELGRGGFAFEAPALGVVSDATWRGITGRQLIGPMPPQPHVPRPDILDAGARPPAGWLSPEFDDAAWMQASVLSGLPYLHDPSMIPGSPYTAPEPSDIGPLTALPLDLQRVAGTGTRSTLDTGGITIATIWLEAEGPAGASVRVTAGEDLRADGSAESAPRLFDLTCRLEGSGAAERFELRDPVGFRYLTVEPLCGARVLATGAHERRHPQAGSAAFSCDDPRLDAIWRTGVRTVQVCSTDAFLDCPGREQNAWLGDAYVHALVTMVSSSDWRLVRRHLRLAGQAPRPDGFLPFIATHDPIGALACTDYALHWIRLLARYHERSGDTATVRELLPVAIRVLDAFEGFRGPDGLLHGVPGIFVDWAMVEKGEVTGTADALYAAALDDTAILARSMFGAEVLAGELEARATLTRSGFEQLWDAERGVYVDGIGSHGRSRRVSQHTNAAAILSGCAPAERWPAILDVILDETRVKLTPGPDALPPEQRWQWHRTDPSELMAFDTARDVVLAQPFFSHFVHQAVAHAGRRDLLADLCLRWHPQVEAGHGTLHELWNMPPGTASRAHGWSSTATFDMTTHLLGVGPAVPGFARAEIRPFFGGLERLAGVVPTPHGEICVELTRLGGEVALPEGVSATLLFEDSALPARELGPGTHTIGRGG
jgi:hypothetical protein